VEPPGGIFEEGGRPVMRGERIGIGRDIHRLTEGRRLILGGVHIPFEKGEDGHSDGDVLTHAVIDALLGAAGAGDIGELFPDTDAAFKDACSIDLLKEAWRRICQKNVYTIVNIDSVISIEKPAIKPFKEQIRAKLAGALGISPECIYVKAKTGEGLGDVGRGQAVEAIAAALLRASYAPRADEYAE
jgi:2-C-methyl-D-erythritol 2,4-cyclodiphosphate synthase